MAFTWPPSAEKVRSNTRLRSARGTRGSATLAVARLAQRSLLAGATPSPTSAVSAGQYDA
jgi:hypothetical protein